MQIDLHPSVTAADFSPIVTNCNRESILRAASALQEHLNGFPFLGSLVVALVPVEAGRGPSGTPPGSDVALERRDQAL